MDRRTDRWTDRWIDRRMDRRTNRRMDGWTDGRTDRFLYTLTIEFFIWKHFGWEKWWTGRLIWRWQAEIKVNFSEFIFIFDLVFAFYYSEQKSRQNMEIKSYWHLIFKTAVLGQFSCISSSQIELLKIHYLKTFHDNSKSNTAIIIKFN